MAAVVMEHAEMISLECPESDRAADDHIPDLDGAVQASERIRRPSGWKAKAWTAWECHGTRQARPVPSRAGRSYLRSQTRAVVHRAEGES
jgi:hypothetical protein